MKRPAAAGERAALQRRLDEAKATAKWQKTPDHYKLLGLARTARCAKGDGGGYCCRKETVKMRRSLHMSWFAYVDHISRVACLSKLFHRCPLSQRGRDPQGLQEAGAAVPPRQGGVQLPLPHRPGCARRCGCGRAQRGGGPRALRRHLAVQLHQPGARGTGRQEPPQQGAAGSAAGGSETDVQLACCTCAFTYRCCMFARSL